MDYKDLSPLEALTLTIIGEARGEPIQGQVAVGWIIKNRLMHKPTIYRDYRDVVFEQEQFSCWNSNSPEKGLMDSLIESMVRGEIFEDMYLKQCEYVAQGIDNNKIIDNTGGNLYYLTSSLFNSDHRPSWAKNTRNARVIGTQTFFMV